MLHGFGTDLHKQVSAVVLQVITHASSIERVRVFFDDRYLDMFVDEMGAIKRLPRNDAATVIYWNNMRAHALEEFAKAVGKHPCIYGDAVLFLRPVWS